MIQESCTGIRDRLAAAFPSASVRLGRHDSVWRGETDLIVIRWTGYQVMARDTALASPTITVAYLPALSKQPTTDTPRDLSPLNIAGDNLIAAFNRPSQGVGYFAPDVSWRLDGMPEPNDADDQWRVEARLIAYALGAAA